MKTLEEIAEFVAEYDELRAINWQVFDLSAASEMLTEMHRQYDNAGEWRMSTPMPAQNCIFWDGDFCIIATQDGDNVTCKFAHEFDLARVKEDAKAKSQELIAMMQANPNMRRELHKRHGAEKAESLILDAETRAAEDDYAHEVEAFKMGDDPKGPFGRCVAVWSEFIGFPIARQEQKKIARPTRRRLERMGVAVEVRTVSLSAASHKAAEPAHSPGARKALHFCRGHWRKGSGASGRIWIAGHWRGDPELGIVLHNYVATIKDMDNRARLIA